MLMQTTCGTPLYMAPEVYFNEPYNGKADVWSLGTMLFQLLTGQLPFQASTHKELQKKLNSCDYQIPKDIKLSSECISFISDCLQKDPSKRSSLRTLTNH